MCSTCSASHEDATDAALRRKNQSKLAGLRHSQAPRHAAALAAGAAKAWMAKMLGLNMRKV
jgi:hypothetical protein